MKKKITIIDYGLGNIFSAQKSFAKVISDSGLDAIASITNNPKEISDSTHIVLPGQGAFDSCMNGLEKISGMVDELNNNVINKKKPFLGICVGMQLLANISYENGQHNGLGWIDGEIKKIPRNNLKLPHIGWNNVEIEIEENKLIKSKKPQNFYFVHSYYFDCKSSKNIVAKTNYGINFSSIISKENIYGVQFHPEKSSEEGLKLIKNFIEL